MLIPVSVQILMRIALGEYDPSGDREYRNRITVWPETNGALVMKELADRGWAVTVAEGRRGRRDFKKDYGHVEGINSSVAGRITYAITPAGVRALVDSMEAA